MANANDHMNSDILTRLEVNSRTTDDTLRHIDLSIDSLLSNGLDLSQSTLNAIIADAGPRSASNRSNNARTSTANDSSSSSFDSSDFDTRRGNYKHEVNKSFRSIIDEFTDQVESGFWEAFSGDPITKVCKESAANLEKQMREHGSEFGNKLGESLSNSGAFKELSNKLTRANTALGNGINTLFDNAASALSGGAVDTTAIKAAGGELLSSLVSLGPEAALAASALAAIEVASSILVSSFNDVMESAGEFNAALSNSIFATQNMSKEMLSNSLDRMSQDFNSYIESSYDVMKDATQEMLNAWDSSLEKITATQGYTKSDLQDLISNYAQRLRDEGLESVVSSADITTNLTKVLEAGLSGTVAEEFAYLATVLTEAVPTEDWFSYASTYASIAANAITSGASQSEAIEYANEQLKSFASNMLYASRELAGGFSTGLSNASSLLEDANKIATSAKTNNTTEISGALTSVSAIVGMVAPGLESSITDLITQLAVGGNSSTLTALRSLAGTGASNTSFLNALAQDPKEVLSTMFSNLSKLQKQSADNYMEVAEGLSDTFGVSIDALARVDFDYLAECINEMNTSSSSLDDNMQLLSSGETTSTAEQLRYQQINEYMIDEGLAYVLDNEVARSIQEHMWDEQIKDELIEATYGVELTGATLTLLQSLSNFVENIFGILNPFSWLGKAGDLINVAKTNNQIDADIKSLLEETKVGNGNTKSLYNLTTRGTDLNLTSSYIELLGKKANYGSGTTVGNTLKAISEGPLGLAASAVSAVASALNSQHTSSVASSPTSKYNWGTVSKSTSSLLSQYAGGRYNGGSAYATLTSDSSAQSKISSASKAKLQSYLDSMQSYVDDNKSYDEWVAAASGYGITDLDAALSDYDLTQSDTQAQFTQMQTSKASEYEYNLEQLQYQFYQDGITYLEETWPLYEETLTARHEEVVELLTNIIDNTVLIIEQLERSNKQLTQFYDSWVDYYVNHTAYTQETLSAYDVAAIKNAEKSETGDAVLALADALTSNIVDLKDPTVQTNVLLSQILIVAEAIMQQNNNTSTVSLPTALSALGLGVTSTT